MGSDVFDDIAELAVKGGQLLRVRGVHEDVDGRAGTVVIPAACGVRHAVALARIDTTMNALVMLLVAAALLFVAAVLLGLARRRRAKRAGRWDYPEAAQNILAAVAVVGAIGGAVALFALHQGTTPRVTSETTAPLVEGSGGVYVTTDGEGYGRRLIYKSPDEDGWIEELEVRFTEAVVREGKVPQVTTKTTTAVASFLWPWDTEASTSYVFTVPAGGVSGLILDGME